MKIRSLLLTILLLSSTAFASKESGLQVSLLTCSTGPSLHAAFGHTAIRIIDSNTKSDLVFDYGIFDWGTPNFLYMFLSGKLQYKLSVKDYQTFYNSYEREGRGITERQLILSPTSEVALFEALVENQKPENRYYDYEFFDQNCATKVRDRLLEANGVLNNPAPADLTFRHGLHQCLEDKPWIKVGVDLILGPSVDKPLTHQESMFLPHLLEENLDHYYSSVSSDYTLLDDEKTVLLEPSQANSESSFYSNPIFVSTLIIVLFGILHQFKKKISKILNYTTLILFGLLGILLILLWTGSRHEPLSNNMNIIWANPLYLILPFLKKGAIRKYTVLTLLIVNSLFVILAICNFLPQEINPVASAAAGLGSGILFTLWMDLRLPSDSSS